MAKFYPILFAILIPVCLWSQDLTIKGSVTVQPDALLYVRDGNVNIYSTGSLDIQSTGSQRGKVYVEAEGLGAATWTCNGNTTGTGEVKFIGNGIAVDYTINGSNVSFPHLIIDNWELVGGFNIATVTLENNVKVTESLALNNGRIVTSNNEIHIANSNPASISGNFGSNYSNFIEGTLRRDVDTGATNYYRFPIGATPKDTTLPVDFRGYNPISIDLRSSIGAIKPDTVNSIAAKFVPMDDIGTISINTVTNNCYYTSAVQFLEFFWMVKKFGYWSVKPDVNNASLVWNYDFYAFPDKDWLLYQNPGLTHLKIFKAPDSFTPGPTADWSPYLWGSGNLCDGVTVYNNDFRWIRGPNDPASGFPFYQTDSIRASGLTSFSNEGLGGGTGAGLPIELLFLQAEPVNNTFIRVKWATATEINNAGFEVQRSTDGVTFEKIAWVDGAGNSSSTLNYNYPDYDVQPNVLYYYRLKQVDLDGTEELTYVVSAMITSSGIFTISDFIPNPAFDNSRIEVVTSTEKDLHVTIYNTLGQIIQKSKHHVMPGTNQITFQLGWLADGTYYAIIHADNEFYSRKLVLNRP
ncbi:MAG: hypothetical protein KatS3mg031_0665 [Chitinophagales bacterium]|nr:MAG: hypothetical protein KatS3mg031_0665 [Chitinophagales bacterium]